jgi:hypothetical protein
VHANGNIFLLVAKIQKLAESRHNPALSSVFFFMVSKSHLKDLARARLQKARADPQPDVTPFRKAEHYWKSRLIEPELSRAFDVFNVDLDGQRGSWQGLHVSRLSLELVLDQVKVQRDVLTFDELPGDFQL